MHNATVCKLYSSFTGIFCIFCYFVSFRFIQQNIKKNKTVHKCPLPIFVIMHNSHFLLSFQKHRQRFLLFFLFFFNHAVCISNLKSILLFGRSVDRMILFQLLKEHLYFHTMSNSHKNRTANAF